MIRSRRVLSCVFLLLFACLMAPPYVRSAEPGFKVLNEVREPGSDEVLGRTVTYICQSRAWDGDPAVPEQGTVFDFVAERVILWDGTRKRKTSLSFDELRALVEELTDRVRSQAAFRFAAQPQFAPADWNAAERRLVLAHPDWTYETVLATPPAPEQAELYRVFADWSARLNTTLPGPPAGPRLVLNQEIAARGGVPEEVLLRRVVGDGTKTRELCSTHVYTWRLEDADYLRLGELNRRMEECQEESLAAHRASQLQSRGEQ